MHRFCSKNVKNKKIKIIEIMANKNQMESIETVDALSKSEAFFIQNKKAIIIAVVALFVIIAGFFLYKSFVSTPRENKPLPNWVKGRNSSIWSNSTRHSTETAPTMPVL